MFNFFQQDYFSCKQTMSLNATFNVNVLFSPDSANAGKIFHTQFIEDFLFARKLRIRCREQSGISPKTIFKWPSV